MTLRQALELLERENLIARRLVSAPSSRHVDRLRHPAAAAASPATSRRRASTDHAPARWPRGARRPPRDRGFGLGARARVVQLERLRLVDGTR